MTSNYRAHQRQAILATVRIVPQNIWTKFKWFLETLTPRYWRFVYESELYDIQYEAHEAEVQEARERLTKDDFVFEEIPF